MIRVGKHRGDTFQEVCETDRSYIAWVLRDNPRGFTRLAKFVREHHGGILEVGRHKGDFFREVLQNDPDYCEWALSLPDPGLAFQKFLEYLRENYVREEPQPPKRQKTDNACKICCDREIDTVLVPCGHILACRVCATKIEQGGICPICKEYICMVVKTYVA